MAKKLTAIGIKNCKTPERRVEQPDAACRGLYLVVQPKTRRKCLAGRDRFGGKMPKLTLAAGLSLAKASVAAAEVMAKVEQGVDPAAARRAARADADVRAGNTLRAVAEAYFKFEEGKSADKRLRTIG